MIAAMHFNENRQREQVVDKNGKKVFDLAFRKARKDWKLVERKAKQTFCKYIHLKFSFVLYVR